MHDLVRWGERIVLIVLAALVIVRLLPTFSLHPQVILLLASEIVGVFFLLTQRKGQWSSDPYTTAIAFICTGAPLCVMPAGVQIAPEWFAMPVVFVGTFIAFAAKLSLARSFGLVPANRGVKTRGAYRFVRHPMYTGYVVNHIGFLLIYFSAWNLAIYALTWTLFWLRAKEEEKFLCQDPDYVAYTGKVRSRIIPGLI